jgi:hypothetical protein
LKAFKPLFFAIFCVAGCLWIFGCNYTRTYTPDYNGKQLVVLDSLHRVFNFEDIEIQDKTTAGMSGINSVLIIKLVNGTNLPADTEKMVALGQKVARQVRFMLEDSKGIDSYEVQFNTKTQDGDNTSTQSLAIDFNSKDL